MHRIIVPRSSDQASVRAGSVLTLICMALAVIAFSVIVSIGWEHLGSAPVNYKLLAIDLVLWFSGLCAVIAGTLLLFFGMTTDELPDNPTWLERAKFALWQFL